MSSCPAPTFDVDYLTLVSRFFKVPFFDFNAAEYFLNTSWPVAIMEVLTLGVLNFPAPNVTAPVLFMKYVALPNGNQHQNS
jgi:hypothetical protein